MGEVVRVDDIADKGVGRHGNKDVRKAKMGKAVDNNKTGNIEHNIVEDNGKKEYDRKEVINENVDREMAN